MYFSDYKNYPDKAINHSLFWEYDLEKFNFQEMKNLVVQRIIERGRIDDFYGMLNLYGLEEVKRVLKNIKILNKKDTNFVSVVFEIPLKELRCYKEQQ